MTRKLLVLFPLLLILAAGCNRTFVVKDEVQEGNLEQLGESWGHMEDEYFSQGAVPPQPLRQSHSDLLDEAKELESAKKKSWQDTARDKGWKPEGEEEEEADGSADADGTE